MRAFSKGALPPMALAGFFALLVWATAPALGRPAQESWSTIRGHVIFGGDKIPEMPKLDVTKDQEHCLEKGPLMSEDWIVNPANKGVRNVVVFLKAPKGQKLPIHPSLKDPAEKQAVLDQPRCAFVPHVLAMREDQELLAKNPAPVAHNVVITGFNNSYNRQIPEKKSETFKLQAEDRAIALTCGAHPWMKGWLWVIDHPYFAVTDTDGKFEIKNAPAGDRNIVLWHEKIGWVDKASGKNGKKIEVKADGVTDLGKIEIKPE